LVLRAGRPPWSARFPYTTLFRSFGGAVLGDGDVVDDPYAVAEAVGAAPLDGLPDGRQAEGLAGVDGEVGVLPLQVFEGVEVAGGRVAGFGAGDVAADDADVAVADGQFGD